MGDNTTEHRSAPVLANGLSDVNFIATGNNFTFATNSSLYAWGLNSGGQLEDINIIHKSTPTIIQTTCTITDIEEQNPKFSLNLFPNPMRSIAVIAFDQTVHQLEIIMVDMLGKKVLHLPYLSGNQIETQRNQLQPGIYQITGFSNNGFTFSEKLIVVD